MHSENDERKHDALQQHPEAAAPAGASQHRTDPAPPTAVKSKGFAGQGSPCPDCGSFTINQSGCWVCMSCGWSKCG